LVYVIGSLEAPLGKKQKTAVIIGAGPAGLTAAYELLQKTDIKPIVFEASNDIGGISKTITYKGNKIDIGGHRFFSKSDEIMDWWLSMLPLEKSAAKSLKLTYQGKTRSLGAKRYADPAKTDDVMLVRSRMSRIYYGGKFYNYPLNLELQTVKNLGAKKMAKIGASYLHSRLRPLPETSLEAFYINRFGRELYLTFFKDYTQKVWGVPCSRISPEWGAQRVKGLSVGKTLGHAVKKGLQLPSRHSDLHQKTTETSLIEYFLYPKYGPGHMWETVAKKVKAAGGQVRLGKAVTEIGIRDKHITYVTVTDTKTGKNTQVSADYVISTMPVGELIGSLKGVRVPQKVRQTAIQLPYRDFITVGLLLKDMAATSPDNERIQDNWIYVQEPSVKVGRLQVFNNWSPYLVKDADHTWIGMEYFVSENDKLWKMEDEALADFAAKELAQIGLVDPSAVLDSTIIRVKKTYPAYFGSYKNFDLIRNFTDQISNLYLVGRNGMHRYNNQDHSMLTAMAAVHNIASGELRKDNIWQVNTEEDYHESK